MIPNSEMMLRKELQASLWKRLAALVYDSLLILAILFLGTALLLPFNGGEALEGQLYYPLYLLALVYFFYAWFWRRSGQTLGMKVWKIRLWHVSGHNAGWGISLLRFIAAMFSWGGGGLGYLWCLFTGTTWHDRVSDTRVIDLKKLDRLQATQEVEDSDND